MTQPPPTTRLRAAMLALLVFGGVLAAGAARAEDDPNAVIKAETERLKAEAELEAARGERDKAAADRIKALGLPSFSGETTLKDGAGAMEATMLATRALQAAANNIAGAIPAGSGKILVLAGSEKVDFADVAMIATEMEAIRDQFHQAGVGGPASTGPSSNKMMIIPLEAGIAAASALAGLLRSETTISPIDLPALSDRALVNAVAGRLAGRAVLPSAAVGGVSNDAPLIATLNELGSERTQAVDQLARLSKTPAAAKANSSKISEIKAAVARFDTFFARVTTADPEGVVPIVRAARLDAMMKGDPQILRVYVDKAGGSLINTKNIATTFGVDPLKVTGAIVASYTLTDPDDGTLAGSNIYVCRTTLSRLRPIHDAAWAARTDKKPVGAVALCTAAD